MAKNTFKSIIIAYLCHRQGLSGNRIVLYWTPETSPFTEYEYEFLENGTKLKMILSSTDVDVFPYEPEIKIYEKIEK